MKKTLPIVLRNSKIGKVEIIYKKRVEIYEVKEVLTKPLLDKENKENGAEEWTSEREVEMAIDNGYKRVNDSDDDRHWELWGASK